MARAIQMVLDEGGVVDTMVYGISVPIQELPSTISAVGMFFVQSVLNFFIPSGSGQAYVTMPIMAPLAGIPYDRWLRLVMPFMVKVAAMGSLALVVAVLIGYD